MGKFIDTAEGRLLVARGWGGRRELGVTVNGNGFQFGVMETFWN